MKPNPRRCARRGCRKTLSWRRPASAILCEGCSAERERLNRRLRNGTPIELAPTNLPRTFSFQPVRDCVPPLEKVRGFEPWIRYLADRMCAADPSMSHGAALKRIHRARLRGTLSWVEADRYAAVLGCHPAELWDNWHEEMAKLDLEGVAA